MCTARTECFLEAYPDVVPFEIPKAWEEALGSSILQSQHCIAVRCLVQQLAEKSALADHALKEKW